MIYRCSLLQELFISELVKGAHKATLESAQNEVTYNHLGEVFTLLYSFFMWCQRSCDMRRSAILVYRCVVL